MGLVCKNRFLIMQITSKFKWVELKRFLRLFVWQNQKHCTIVIPSVRLGLSSGLSTYLESFTSLQLKVWSAQFVLGQKGGKMKK